MTLSGDGPTGIFIPNNQVSIRTHSNTTLYGVEEKQHKMIIFQLLDIIYRRMHLCQGCNGYLKHHYRVEPGWLYITKLICTSLLSFQQPFWMNISFVEFLAILQINMKPFLKMSSSSHSECMKRAFLGTSHHIISICNKSSQYMILITLYIKCSHSVSVTHNL